MGYYPVVCCSAIGQTLDSQGEKNDMGNLLIFSVCHTLSHSQCTGIRLTQIGQIVIFTWMQPAKTEALVKWSRSPRIMRLVRAFVLQGLQIHTFIARLVSSLQNGIADALSRFQVEHFHRLAPLACPDPDIMPLGFWTLGLSGHKGLLGPPWPRRLGGAT